MAIDKTKVLKSGQLIVDRETDPDYNILYIGDGITPISGLKPVGQSLDWDIPPDDGIVYAMVNGSWQPQAITEDPSPWKLSKTYPSAKVDKLLSIKGRLVALDKGNSLSMATVGLNDWTIAGTVPHPSGISYIADSSEDDAKLTLVAVAEGGSQCYYSNYLSDGWKLAHDVTVDVSTFMAASDRYVSVCEMPYMYGIILTTVEGKMILAHLNEFSGDTSATELSARYTAFDNPAFGTVPIVPNLHLFNTFFMPCMSAISPFIYGVTSPDTTAPNAKPNSLVAMHHVNSTFEVYEGIMAPLITKGIASKNLVGSMPLASKNAIAIGHKADGTGAGLITDATTWNGVTTSDIPGLADSVYAWHDIEYIADIDTFVVVGANSTEAGIATKGAIKSSKDGLTWKAVEAPSNIGFTSICVHDGKVLVGGHATSGAIFAQVPISFFAEA